MQNTTREYNWILDGQFFLFILTIILGTLTFLSHKKEIDMAIEKEQNSRVDEEKRKKIFDLKFPNVSQIPIIRTIFSWFYKEGSSYSLALIIIVFIGFFVRIFGLGDFDFREDEFLVMRAATTYHFNKEFYLWDWIKKEPSEYLYQRAWPHTFLVAKAFDIFGISEWSARLVSVLFGTAFIIISYFIIKYFTNNKKIALLTTFAFALNPSYIELSRYTRMYSLLFPIFILLAYLFYRGIIEGVNPNSKVNLIIKRIPAFDFNYSFLFIGLVLSYIGYIIHINVLVVFPVLLMFSLYLYILRREKKYFFFTLSFAIMALILYLFIAIYLGGYFTTFNKNFYYVKYLAQYPFLTKFPFYIVIGEFGLILSL